MKKTIFAAVCVVVSFFGCVERSTAQTAPGVFADANHPSGAPDPEKLDEIWTVDPINNSVSVNIPFTTTPQGGRGPTIPFSLQYNSASTITLQSTAAWALGGGGSGTAFSWLAHPSAFTLNTLTAPSGPWTTSGPYFYSAFSNIPDFGFTDSNGDYHVTMAGCGISGPFNYSDQGGATHDLSLVEFGSSSGYASQAYAGNFPWAPPCGNALTASTTYWPTSLTSDGSAMLTGDNSAIGPDGVLASSGTTTLGAWNGGATLTDPSGNAATLITSGGVATATDAIGRTVYQTNIPVGKPGQIPAGSYYVTTYNTSGVAETYNVTFSSVTIGSFTMPHPTVTEITSAPFCMNCNSEFTVNQPATGDTLTAITAIQRPDGSSYSFTYDPTYGTVSKITFPTGGYVRFAWGVRDKDWSPYSQFSVISTLVVTDAYVSTGSGENHWSYAMESLSTSSTPIGIVTAPDQTATDYTGACFIYNRVPYYQYQAKASCKEASSAIYNNNGILMKTVAKEFDVEGETLQEATSVYDGPHPLQQLSQFTYDFNSNVTEKDESDFYTCGSNPCTNPTPGTALAAPSAGWLRKTFTTFSYTQPYCPQSGTCPSGEAAALTSSHIVNKPSQALITDGNGHPYSLTQYGYDEPNSTGFKGSLTTESHCAALTTTATVTSGTAASACSGWLQTKHIYDSNGQVLSTTDPAGNTTSFSYTDSYVGFTPSSQTDGYVTTVTHPDGTTDKFTHYYYTGQPATHTDQNSQVTSYTYGDSLNRVTLVKLPSTTDGTTGSAGNGETAYTYNDVSGAFSVQEKHLITGTTWTSVTKTFDGLGREITTVTASPQCSTGIEVDTLYDSMSREASVSNPYCSTSDSTYGLTQFSYDALDRKTQTELPDGFISTIAYAGNATETTDPFNGTTNVQHIQQSDGLGRLTNVCEVTSVSLGSGTPGACGLNITGTGYLTAYAYDTLGNMTCVEQHGGVSGTGCSSSSSSDASSPWHVRRFVYDGLSRLLSAKNPEAGSTPDTYTYLNSTLTTPANKPGNAALPVTKTDARGVVTTYTYDTMSRLTSKSYSVAASNTTGAVSDLTSCYQYSTKFSAATDSYPIGQLTAEWQQAGACPTTAQTAAPTGSVGIRIRSVHDAVGRVGKDQQCLTAAGCSATTGKFVYTYNLLGSPVQVNNGIVSGTVTATQSDTTNPTLITAPSITWKTTYDEMGHITNAVVQDQPAATVFPASTYLANPTLLSPTNYDTFGHMTGAQMGIPYGGTTPALSQARQYDDRGRILYEVDNGTGSGSQAQHSLGTISITGAEQGPVYPASSFATATVSVGGTEQDGTFNTCPGNPHGPCNQTIPDAGTVSLTVNGVTISTNYGMGITSSVLALALAGQVSTSGMPANASVSGSTITLRTTTPGTAGNSITISSTSATTVTPYYTSPSFTISNTAFAGGTNVADNTYDTGTVSATVGGVKSTVSYTSASTPQSIATALAAAIQSASGSKVTAKSDGDVNVLVSTGTGTSDDYAITTAVTYDSTDFFAPSFAAAAYTMQDGVAADSSDGLVYYYYVPNGGYAPNGNILAHSDLIMGDWIFAYDTADRLASALPSYTTQPQYTGMTACWSYDAFGNRTMEAFSSAACNNNPTPQVLTTYNSANNRVVNSTVSPNTITGVGTFIYDASGNTLYDGNNRYWYDAEGQLCAVQSQRSSGAPVIQYVYDAEGARIAKGTLAAAPSSYTATCAPPLGSGFTLNSRYLVDQGGDQVTEFSEGTSETWAHSNIWTGGKLVATYDVNGGHGGIHFDIADPLGTKRVQLNAAGQIDETCTSLPFGNDVNNPVAASCLLTPTNALGTNDDATEQHFTAKERDTETGNDYFFARYYTSALGRFTTPDWSAKETPVPYATFTDPQSLNLYAYVRNNPIIRMDADGHTCKQGDWGCNAWNSAAENWNKLHEIAVSAGDKVNQGVQAAKKVAKEHPRTMRALKGGLKMVGGAATVGIAATSEVGTGGLATVPVIFAIMGGSSASVSGFIDVLGAATNTDTSKADDALSATSNPAGLVTTVVTGGNLHAGAQAGAIGDALVTGATLGDVVKGSRALVGVKAALAGQSLSEGADAAQEVVRPESK